MQTKKAWLLTKKGIAFSRKCIAATSIGFLCYEVFPNTILLPFYRARHEEAMQARLGLKDLPYQVQEYVRRAIEDLKFTEDQRKTLSVYLADLNESATFGNVNSIFGTLVKLPWLLWSHYPIQDFVKDDDGKHPEATKEYFQSLQWSDKAKLYFTAYQVAWTTRYKFFEQGIFNAVAIVTAYAACYLFSFSVNRITDNYRALITINALFLVIFYVSWMFATDLTTCENEEQIIREVCSLGPDYAEGAVELYKKLQQHNRAVREITGFIGRVKFSEEGNTKSPRRLSIPLGERLTLAEEYVGKYKNESNTDVSIEKNQLTQVKKEGVVP